MAYQATVLPIMIASPGDVSEERDVARTVIHDWNYLNSVSTGVVLMPVGWDTHSSPELGERPQALINQRVLGECDILIGVFWTRLGSPTGVADSGTVEEIEEHVKAGKPALLYFSSKPVAPQSINPDQYEAVQRFKRECQSRGLVEQFDTILEFREKLFRQLHICLNKNEHLRRILDEATPGGVTVEVPEVDIRPGRLSPDAKYLLKLASKDKNGLILKVATLSGRFIQAGGQSLGGSGGRESSKWEGALNELIGWSYVTGRGVRGEVYELTIDGWKLADTLPEAA
ncbi:MAG: hypothetical protein HOP35_05205 [Nitrospira sp.]|nr:hypothetical protein [Nitrospira sp.]